MNFSFIFSDNCSVYFYGCELYMYILSECVDLLTLDTIVIRCLVYSNSCTRNNDKPS